MPALLLVVCEGDGRCRAAEIQDTLEVAAAGTVLETLSLERAGATLGSGLTDSDPVIHDMRLIRADVDPVGDDAAPRFGTGDDFRNGLIVDDRRPADGFFPGDL